MFKAICLNNTTLQELTKATKKSNSWVSEILTQLKKEDFVQETKHEKRSINKIQINKNTKKSRKSFKVSKTKHAQTLKELIFIYQKMDFENLITGTKLRTLAAILFDWKDYNIIAKMLKTTPHAIRQITKPLQNRGLITKKGRLLKFNSVAWPKMFEFLKSWRNLTNTTGYLIWKFEEEIIFAIDRKELVQGSLTGLNRYKDFGVWVGTISGACHLPKAKLSKEEVFIHSLLQVNHPRLLHLALTFYLKNSPNEEKIKELAMYYDCYSRLIELKNLPKVTEKYKKLKAFNTTFDRIDFYRIADMYDVKNVRKK